MTAKPTLGYATRTDAVLALRRSGRSTQQIADAIGISRNIVSALEQSAGRNRSKPRPAEQLGRVVVFPDDLIAALGPHAARRGIHPNTLARRIVQEVVDSAMVDAVLDDAG